MTLRLQIDPGGEKYFSFAKQKLRQLKDGMVRQNVSTARKQFQIAAGESIFIHSVRTAPDTFLDFIRITYGAGCIILRTGPVNLAVIRWDGSLVAHCDLSGWPFASFPLHEAIGTDIIFGARIGGSAYTAYVVDANTLSTKYGPGDFSSAGFFQSYTYYQPPAVAEVIPPKRWVGAYDLLSATSLSGLSVGVITQDLSVMEEVLSPSGESTNFVLEYLQWNSDGNRVYAALGRGFDEHRILAVSPVTGATEAITLVGTTTSRNFYEPLTPICTNSQYLLWPCASGDTNEAFIEVYSLATGERIAQKKLMDLTAASAMRWPVLRCDETRAIMILGDGNSPTAYKSFVLDLATFGLSEISEKVNENLTVSQLGYVNTVPSRAIILSASITGVVATPPPAEPPPDEGGGGGRE